MDKLFATGTIMQCKNCLPNQDICTKKTAKCFLLKLFKEVSDYAEKECAIPRQDNS